MVAAPPLEQSIRALIELAVGEDLGMVPATDNKSRPEAVALDRTVALTIPSDLTATGKIVARKPGVICGTFLIPAILAHYDRRLQSQIHIADGHNAAAGAAIAHISGPAGALLAAERVVLNFLGHLSGIATLTSYYVAAAGGKNRVDNKPLVCDTRKTTPGWRTLEKYAVRCGGGIKHRMGRYDGGMLKDNHLSALRHQSGASLSVADITRNIRGHLPPGIKLWLEVDTLEQLREALPGAADIILLDNMNVEQLRQAVLWRNAVRPGGPPLLEASGGVTLSTIAAIAATGVDRISVGAITHSAPALDLAMDFTEHD